MAAIPSLQAGLRLRTIVLIALAVALAVTLFALGIAISHMTLQSIEKEEGNKLSAEAKYFAELLDLTIGQQLMDLRSRAAVLPQLGLHQNPDRLAPWLGSIQQEFSDYTWIGFANSHGMVVSATGELLKGKSVAAREWFIRGQHQPTTVDMHPALILAPSLPSRADGPWRFIDLASPVHSHRGDLLGVLGAHLSWDWLIRHHQRFSDSLLRNRHADILVAGDDGLARLTSPTSRVHLLSSLESFRRAKSGESGWIRERWPEGQTFLVGYTPNPGYGEHHQLGWVTLIRLPEEHISTLAAPALWAVWAALGIAMLILIGAVIVLVKFAIYPIETFALQAQLVAQEGGRMRITSAMSRELRVLAQATNEIIDALKRRENSEQSKMRLIADVSHEMRNPMQGVMGYARLIQSRLSAAQDRHDIEQLIRCARAAMDVSADTLLISANEAGELKLKPRPTQLRECIAAGIAMLEPAAREKGLAVRQTLTIDPGLRVLADDKRLTQVMLNLLSNAIKFTDHGSITVMAHAKLLGQHQQQREQIDGSRRLKPHDRPPNHGDDGLVLLEISVTDTGIGMSAQEEQRVFHRWQQAESHRTLAQDGAGLGLSISQAIIEAMGGRLSMSSAAHQGTTVRITLTLPIQSPTDHPAQGRTHDAGNLPAQPSAHEGAKALRILVVDDVSENREVLTRWLEMHGHHVRQAGDGALALAQAQDAEFDVIFMDIDLPDMSGRDAARAIRRSNNPSCQAVIYALSGHGFQADIAASLDAGMDQHIIKPLDFEALHQLLVGIYPRGGRNTPASS